MDNPFKSPAILSLCSGMCGLERGIERAIGELRIAAYVEVESFIIENLLSLMEQGILAPAPVWANLKTFPTEQFHGKIHGIMGGYPCQPFSNAGQRKGIEDPRHLWPFIFELVRTIRPVWCFFENVPGHITMGFDQVYKDLSSLGYNVEAGIYSAEEVGAPHQRKRLFILAIQAELSNSACLGYSGQKHEICAGQNSAEFASQELGNATSIRRLWICENGRSIEENQNRKECRLHELARASSLSEHGSFTKSELAFPDRFRCLYGQPEVDTTERRLNAFSDFTACGKVTRGVDLVNPTSWRSGELPNKNRSRKRLRTSRSGRILGRSKKLADSRTTGLERNEWTRSDLEKDYRGQEGDDGTTSECSDDKWPARPGEQQYDWEEPRTISKEEFESRLGGSNHGYNFREDLLRMYGNGVVEQTAEIAFIDLLKKHGILISRKATD